MIKSIHRNAKKQPATIGFRSRGLQMIYMYAIIVHQFLVMMNNYESDALPTELSRRMLRRVYVSVYVSSLLFLPPLLLFLPQNFLLLLLLLTNTLHTPYTHFTHTHTYQHASDISIAQHVVVAKIDIDGVDQQHH
jgi:hypothetical protein